MGNSVRWVTKRYTIIQTNFQFATQTTAKCHSIEPNQGYPGARSRPKGCDNAPSLIKGTFFYLLHSSDLE